MSTLMNANIEYIQSLYVLNLINLKYTRETYFARARSPKNSKNNFSKLAYTMVAVECEYFAILLCSAKIWETVRIIRCATDWWGICFWYWKANLVYSTIRCVFAGDSKSIEKKTAKNVYRSLWKWSP